MSKILSCAGSLAMVLKELKPRTKSKAKVEINELNRINNPFEIRVGVATAFANATNPGCNILVVILFPDALPVENNSIVQFVKLSFLAICCTRLNVFASDLR